MRPKSLLIVCLGNTCRSPMAEAMAKRRWPNSTIRSAGIDVPVEGGRPADEAITVMDSLNIDIRGHKATSLSTLDLSQFQFIAALEKKVRRTLIDKYGIDEKRIIDLFVKDPYDRGIEQYEECATEISRKLNRLVQAG